MWRSNRYIQYYCMVCVAHNIISDKSRNYRYIRYKMSDTARNFEYMGACIFEVMGWQRPIISNLRGGCRKGSIFDNHPQHDHLYSNIHMYIRIYINSIF
jgi:hypothetical protein